MIDDGNVASIMQRVENREWVEFPLQRVREVFVKIVILPVTEGVTRSAIKVLYNSLFHYLVCPNTANSFAVTLSVMDFLKRRGETMETMDVEALYAAGEGGGGVLRGVSQRGASWEVPVLCGGGAECAGGEYHAKGHSGVGVGGGCEVVFLCATVGSA